MLVSYILKLFHFFPNYQWYLHSSSVMSCVVYIHFLKVFELTMKVYFFPSQGVVPLGGALVVPTTDPIKMWVIRIDHDEVQVSYISICLHVTLLKRQRGTSPWKDDCTNKKSFWRFTLYLLVCFMVQYLKCVVILCMNLLVFNYCTCNVHTLYK